jgi:hypothetical protein
MGHYCRICGRSRPNEQFSGRGHRIHICRECQRLPRETRDRLERLDELHGFLDQSVISARNVARLKTLSGHEDQEVAEHAALILEIAHVLPGKRNRWLKLARHHRPLFDRTVAFFGVEFFEDLLAGYGDFGSPLRHILEQHRITPPWTTRACDCGGNRPFRDCCLDIGHRRDALGPETGREKASGYPDKLSQIQPSGAVAPENTPQEGLHRMIALAR